jgi:hypothetical protein
VKPRDRVSRWLPPAGAIVAAVIPGVARAEPPRPAVDVAVHHAPGLPVLEARADDSGWQIVCVPPCSRRLDAGASYRIGGEGVVASSPFSLPLTTDRVTVDAYVGSPLLRDVGTVLVLGGFAFAAGGGALLLVPSGRGDRSEQNVVGAGFLVGGLLTLGVGLVARILSDTTVAIATPAETR